jgi:hypothetical protein
VGWAADRAKAPAPAARFPILPLLPYTQEGRPVAFLNRFTPERLSAPKVVFDSEMLNVEVERAVDGEHVFARLTGKVLVEEGELLISQRPVELGRPVRSFSVRVELTSSKPIFELLVVLPKGTIEQEMIGIDYFDRRNPPRAAVKTQPKPQTSPVPVVVVDDRVGLTAGLGYALQNYTEGQLEPFAQKAMVLKVAYQKSFSALSPFFYNFSGYFTLLSLSQSDPAPTVRFMGESARIGYRLPLGRSRFEFSVSSGFYYATMLVSATDDGFPPFGYSDQFGPLILPTIKYSLSKRASIGIYFKYSPLNFGISDREIAAGLSVSYALAKGKSLSLTFDQADLKTTLQGLLIDSRSQTLGLGLSW